MSSQCLICTGLIRDGLISKEESIGAGEYHLRCVRRLFGGDDVPHLDYKLSDLAELAKKVVRQRVTLPGVQAKLSLTVEKKTGETPELTIVGLWGGYILKPPAERWPELPENEHCTLRMAEAAGIDTVPYGLIRLRSGEPAFITRRIDRRDGIKLAMEDMCQLTGRLTEDKYKGSHEQIAKTIKTHTANPMLDVVRFYELVLFCYLTGNGDMHLKNFSLIREPNVGLKLAPAYDLLSTRLVIPESVDPEELALTVMGKRSKFSRSHFQRFGTQIGLTPKQVENQIEKLGKRIGVMREVIDSSFLSPEMKTAYNDLLDERGDVFQNSR